MGNAGTKFNRNAILTGQLTSYCLVCNELIEEHGGLDDHVSLSTHKDNIDKEIKKNNTHACESIIKVQKGYYCKICNTMISTNAKLKIHIQDTVHLNSKVNGFNLNQKQIDLNATKENIIALGCINIDHKTWNAIVNNTCMVCNKDLEESNVKSHIEDVDHQFLLMQAFVSQYAWFLYRKLGDTSVQCLTCNQIVPESKLDAHFRAKSHENNFIDACAGRIKRRDVTRYDVNKHLNIKNFMKPSHQLCLLCHEQITEDAATHANGYHHKNMQRLHEQWVESRRWSHEGVDGVPLMIDGIDVEQVPSDKEDDDARDDQIKDALIKMALTSLLRNPKSDGRKQKNKGGKAKPAKQDEDAKNPAKQNEEDNEQNNLNTEENNIGKGPQNTEKNKIHNDFNTEENNIGKGPQSTKKDTVQNNSNTEEKNVGMAANTEDASDEFDTVQTECGKGDSKENMEKKAMSKFAEDYAISYQAGVAKCTVCDEKIKETLQDMESHISSLKHKRKCLKTTKVTPLSCDAVRVEEIAGNAMLLQDMGQSAVLIRVPRAVVSLSTRSFACVALAGARLRCELCAAAFQPRGAQAHSQDALHRRMIGQCRLVTSFDGEFVREIRHGVYHCGHCNLVVGDWNCLLLHLMHRSHRLSRMAASRSATYYKAMIG